MDRTTHSAAVLPRAEEQPTVPPGVAFKALGYGRTAGYELIAQGHFPVPVIRLGHKIRIPTAPLRALLGLDGEHAHDAAAS